MPWRKNKLGAPLNLRAQLLLIVGGTLLLLLLLESIVSYRIGIHITNQVFDRWLLDSAYSLVQEVQEHGNDVHFVADQRAIEVFDWDEIDNIYYQVLGQDGELIAGMPEIQATAGFEMLSLGPVFADWVFNGERTRAVSLSGLADTNDPFVVTVAETLNKRQAMIGELLFEVLLSKAVLLVAVLLIIGVAFERGLRPLVRLSKELSQRSPQELTPIELGMVPGELHGLIENTNQLLARIDAAISSREQFIGNIAHQIRTPLAGMKLQAQLAQYDADDMVAVQAALDRIVHASDHMAHVNSQLMKLAKAESALGRGLRREKVDLVALVRNCCAELTWRSHTKKIQLLQSLPDHPLVVLGEMTLLTEMVSNLVENAIIYGDEKGHIWITLQDTPAGPRLEIEDDGPGIAQEHWPQIFDRFFRPNPAAGEGCGLGLSIVREIALAHGASVHLEDRGEGSGIRFVVQFSVAQGVFRSEA